MSVRDYIWPTHPPETLRGALAAGYSRGLLCFKLVFPAGCYWRARHSPRTYEEVLHTGVSDLAALWVGYLTTLADAGSLAGLVALAMVVALAATAAVYRHRDSPALDHRLNADDRARLTVPDIGYLLMAIAAFGALAPVFYSALDDNAASLSPGTAYLFQIGPPVALIVVFVAIYVKAAGGLSG